MDQLSPQMDPLKWAYRNGFTDNAVAFNVKVVSQFDPFKWINRNGSISWLCSVDVISAINFS
jgi:hypothetical protein